MFKVIFVLGALLCPLFTEETHVVYSGGSGLGTCYVWTQDENKMILRSWIIHRYMLKDDQNNRKVIETKQNSPSIIITVSDDEGRDLEIFQSKNNGGGHKFIVGDSVQNYFPEFNKSFMKSVSYHMVILNDVEPPRTMAEVQKLNYFYDSGKVSRPE